MNLAMTDQFFHICRPFFPTTKTYGALSLRLCEHLQVDPEKLPVTEIPKSEPKTERTSWGEVFWSHLFDLKVFPSDLTDLISDISAFEAHFMALQHDAVPWIAAQKRKGEKEKRTCQDGSRLEVCPSASLFGMKG